ncbi:pentatricopeptide repeat-containing protein At2g20710, mitochondrial-like [Rosa rugosa]|uniref:pentatricopeptide repeat-containing protein At2g20710, mitochondrial-like n=1 Tax=Rosa rugosa TaxID=74645 RepID=UPI002B417324|nr:pentatricopeptide repeat-containing protein At2g20710, mitochondrial-like [Rosa rugosa]
MNLLPSNPWHGNATCRVLTALFYSTKTLPSSPSPSPSPSLYRRILHAGDGNPRVSITPVLNQWLNEGRGVQKPELVDFIKQLRKCRRFNHALELSEWMTGEMRHGMTAGDVSTRLDLISKVHGLEEADKYFDGVSGSGAARGFRGMRVYGALLFCYVDHKCVEKAERLFERMKELGYVEGVWAYNTMLTLYFRMCESAKVDVLVKEMEDRGIGHNSYTLRVLLGSYAASCDVERMEKVMMLMEEDGVAKMDWNGYVFAADAFRKAGQVERALALLGTAEQKIRGKDERRIAYEHLITLYAATGDKRQVFRIWGLYRKLRRFSNRGYHCMISSLVKLDDIGGAERICREWESGFKYFDGKIPRLLINAYCSKGLFQKAKSYVQRLAESGKEDVSTWLALAEGFCCYGRVSEAVETMRKAASLPCRPGWRIHHSTLVGCLDYLKEKGDVEGAHELMRLLREKGHLRADLCDKFENYIHGETQIESLISGEEENHMEGLDGIQDGEASDSGAQQWG